ncbi:MAG: molecular chaperone GrpE, partial [Thermoanaerobaculia bacterium]|nr:molecular chaperone GrpE [Thermoanaerobaculia bacterium]
MSENEKDDDAYVIEDTGETVADIEQEMEAAAQEAAAGTSAAAAQNEDFRDRYMRTLADFENFRKRSEREKADFQRYALGSVIRDLLPVLDNFDRALEHAEDGDEFHKGVSLIYKQLFDVLQRHGLKPITESGVRFDPNFHEAVIREEDPSVPSHTVTAVLQKGYFLHDRLLRPAMVKV